MPISRGLVISLGTSVLGCTLLFLYFRNRISVIERKVDVMFDLIQNHNQQQPPVEYEEQPNKENIKFSVREKQLNEYEDQEEQVQDNDDRIVISDDEDDAFDSDDSEEVSDTEDNDVSLNLQNSENVEISDIKTITLENPENSELQNNDIDSLDEIDDDDEDEDEDEEEDDNEQEDGDEQEEQQEELKEKSADEEEESLDDVESTQKFDYSGLKVSELKTIAGERGLSSYKSLKKNALINLLKANE